MTGEFQRSFGLSQPTTGEFQRSVGLDHRSTGEFHRNAGLSHRSTGPPLYPSYPPYLCSVSQREKKEGDRINTEEHRWGEGESAIRRVEAGVAQRGMWEVD